MIVIADCNNFYASCERLFRPDLERRPVIVLSNNDGCAIARSNEAKKLGIKMGAPFFQIKPLIKQHEIAVFSSNFALYGDLSDRVMSELDRHAPDISVYSVDEAFLDFDGFVYAPLQTYLLALKAQLKQAIGIPISLGGGQTKTLAKMANKLAKKYPQTSGVYLLDKPDKVNFALKKTAINDVWGVGRRLTEKLNAQGIQTAWDLAHSDVSLLRRCYGVVLERTVRELNGVRCIPFHEAAKARQQIIVSRSFSRRITDYEDLASLIAGYTARGAEKLRDDHSVARHIAVFIRTSPFSDEPQYSAGLTIKLGNFTADTALLVKSALSILQRIFRRRYRYAKAGVVISDIAPQEQMQLSLFSAMESVFDHKKKARMEVLDSINLKWGTQTAHFGGERKARWDMKQEHLSPRYTTHWESIITVK